MDFKLSQGHQHFFKNKWGCLEPFFSIVKNLSSINVEH